MAKIIVLSDIHLSTPEDIGHDLGNHARLDAAIAQINTAYSDANLVVIAGDLADRGRHLAPYEDLKAALAQLSPPHALTIGNHDARENFLSVFGPAYADENGFIQSAHTLGETCVIILDSASDQPPPPGFRRARSPVGELCAARLAWLNARLKDAQDRPVIVILHHPPMQLQITSDEMALQAPDALIDCLFAHGNVRQVISGHIHMTTTAFHRGISFTTIAGGFSTTAEDFGRRDNKIRREGPAQMAVILTDANQTIVHFDNYADAHHLVKGR